MQNFVVDFRKFILENILTLKVRHILSIPFIYMFIFPTIILDIFLFIYQQTCFRLYGIPLVKRAEYISIDREKLPYLNLIQKINCAYCTYVNGIISYGAEIGGRTEKYWCPIKHEKKNKTTHNWQKDFADYGDEKGFKQKYQSNDIFM